MVVFLCQPLPLLGSLFLHRSYVMMFSGALDLWLVVSAARMAESWGCVWPGPGSGVLEPPARESQKSENSRVGPQVRGRGAHHGS